MGTRLQHWQAGVAELIEVIRYRVNAPLTADSGYRCPRHNAAVAISERSQHSIGAAVDLACPQGWTLIAFHAVCLEVVSKLTGGQGGVGYYPRQNFIHVDLGLGELPGRKWTA
jgi:uncharacterized protein YcbK (DUF882 family)